MKTPTENLAKVRATIANRILNSTLSQHIGYPGHAERLVYLQHVADESNGDTSYFSFIRVEFHKADSSCSLYVECQDTGDWNDRTDNDGNEWSKYQITAKPNWPCHGSSDSGVALARLKFYTDVAYLAAEIQAEFGSMDVAHMTATKAQVETRNAKRDAEKLERAYRALAQELGPGRKNKCTSIPLEMLAGIPDGQKTFTFDDREYTVTVNSSSEGTFPVSVGYITRSS